MNLKYLNKKIKYYNLVFLINSNLDEIKKLNKIISLIKIKYFIKNNKINILFIELKNIFKENKVIGKINFNNKELINKKIINKMKGI